MSNLREQKAATHATSELAYDVEKDSEANFDQRQEDSEFERRSPELRESLESAQKAIAELEARLAETEERLEQVEHFFK